MSSQFLPVNSPSQLTPPVVKGGGLLSAAAVPALGILEQSWIKRHESKRGDTAFREQVPISEDNGQEK
jgi:hypothetical protein